MMAALPLMLVALVVLPLSSWAARRARKLATP
jgi:hypothetical protein